jgi:hypothetical protein
MMPDCRCTHPYEFHQHMHTRTYCGTCDCRAYRRPPGRFMAWVQRWLGD